MSKKQVGGRQVGSLQLGAALGEAGGTSRPEPRGSKGRGSRPASLALRRLSCLALLVLTGSQMACARSPEVIVETAQGRAAAPAQIDLDPYQLLPSGAVAFGEFSVPELAAAAYGPTLLAKLESQSPLAACGVYLRDSAKTAHFGIYATAGNDLALILVGKFQPADILSKAQAVSASSPGPSSGSAATGSSAATESHPAGDTGSAASPVLRVQTYAGQKLVVGGEFALSALTEHTLVVGSLLGVRRVLERIEEGRLARNLPAWYEALLKSPQASLRFGFDLDAQPVPSAVRTELDFLQGLRGARLLGNFREPGLNLAGSLTYDKPEVADKAVKLLLQHADELKRASLLTALLGVPRPLRKVEAQSKGKDAQVALEVEGKALLLLLERFPQLAGQLGYGAQP